MSSKSRDVPHIFVKKMNAPRSDKDIDRPQVSGSLVVVYLIMLMYVQCCPVSRLGLRL